MNSKRDIGHKPRKRVTVQTRNLREWSSYIDGGILHGKNVESKARQVGDLEGYYSGKDFAQHMKRVKRFVGGTGNKKNLFHRSRAAEYERIFGKSRKGAGQGVPPSLKNAIKIDEYLHKQELLKIVKPIRKEV